MRGLIKAVAFDIDGTLYPARRQTLRLIPFTALHFPFMVHFFRVRKQLHRAAAGTVYSDFYQTQAELIGAATGKDSGSVKRYIDEKIYRGWESVYRRIVLYPDVRQTLADLRNAGLKTAILSDFPPDSKLAIWQIADLFDAVLGSEKTGALKPSPLPFLKTAEALGVMPQEVLYVGNKENLDIRGARSAGMMTALITAHRKKNSEADIQFRTYNELKNIILR